MGKERGVRGRCSLFVKNGPYHRAFAYSSKEREIDDTEEVTIARAKPLHGGGLALERNVDIWRSDLATEGKIAY